MKTKLKDQYKLNAILNVKTSYSENPKIDINTLRSGIVEEIYQKQRVELEEKELEIQILKEELNSFKQVKNILNEIAEEIKIEHPNVKEISFSKGYHKNLENNQNLEKTYVILKTKKKMPVNEKTKIIEFLKVRLKNREIQVLFEGM